MDLKKLKERIEAKRDEVKAYRNANNKTEALKAAKELNNLVDEYEEEKELIESFNRGEGWFVGPSSAYPVNAYNNIKGIQGDEYHRNFFNALRSKFKNDVTLKLSEGSLSQGGYLIPSQFADKIQSALEEENSIRKIARVISTRSEYLMPYVATKPTATWLSEGQQINLTTETFERMTLGAHKLGAAITLSNELLSDSLYDLEAHLVQEFSRAIARAEEEAFITGAPESLSGTVTRPTGILTTINENSDYYKETQTAKTISADDLINLQYSVRRPYRRNACFLTSDETLAQIRKLKDSTSNFIWQSSLIENEPSKLLGQPIYTSPYMPAPDSGKTCVLYGDFNYYVIAERGQRTCRALHELFALQDISAFIMLERIDGKLTDKNAIRGLKIK